MNWLDTETKAILQKEDESKLTLTKTAEFALVLIRNGAIDGQLVRAIRRINECNESEAIKLARHPTPFTINSGLNEAEAYFGQFELICCNAVAAFVRSEVILQQDDYVYLRSLFQKVAQSPEFRPTRIDILEVPATEAGERFVDQFFWSTVRDESFSCVVPYKKARIMKHWAVRVGAEVRCDVVEQVNKDEDGF